MFASAHERPRQSKATMVAALATIGRAPISAKLAARNTLDYVDATGARRIRLHNTDILTFPPKGGFVINTDGWNTVTTRARLNEVLPGPWRVFTARGLIHLRNIETGVDTPFRETVTVTSKGAIKPDRKPASNDKLRQQIDTYMKAFKARGLPTAQESLGDPWIFSEGKTDSAVMLDWIKSKYVHRRLMALAFQWTGLTDRGVALYLSDIDRRGGKLNATDMRRLRRYVRLCVGLG